MYKFNTIEEAISDIKDGKIIIVVDNPDRENEGDLLMAAEKVTGEAINFMAKYGRGLICMPVEEERLNELKIGPMVENNTDNHETAFTVAIDHASTTTGISAFERAITIQKVLDDNTKPEDFRRPGHVFPLVAKKNGVLERNGHKRNRDGKSDNFQTIWIQISAYRRSEKRPAGLYGNVYETGYIRAQYHL